MSNAMKTLFIDESGDPNLVGINLQYPVFVLAGAVFDKNYAETSLAVRTRSVKRELFNNTEIIFHTSDISGATNGFEPMQELEFRERFYRAMNSYVGGLDFKAIICGIRKIAHKQRYGETAYDPYPFSLHVLVERFCFELMVAQTTGQIIAESRGKGPDSHIWAAWESLLTLGTYYVSAARISQLITNFEFRQKSENIPGLQIADLVANPIGRYILGKPDSKHISTSYAERQNLTMRMHMRRFTRLTNAFSKKVENLAAAVSLYYMWYNFARVHMSLRVTPAMEAGVSEHVWSLEEIAELLPVAEPGKRGPYKKQFSN